MNVLREAVKREPDNVYLHAKLANQYAMMQRSPYFVAETMKIKALRAGAGRASGASSR
jgi:hypothetical protein